MAISRSVACLGSTARGPPWGDDMNHIRTLAALAASGLMGCAGVSGSSEPSTGDARGPVHLTAPAATTKTVAVTIYVDDFMFLKQNGYNLCFAKKVDNTYDVVWSSETAYLQNNSFSWTPHYAIFGRNDFTAGVLVDTNTNTQPIDLGQQALLDVYGTIEAPSSIMPLVPPDDTLIRLVNQYGPIHPGLMAVHSDLLGNFAAQTPTQGTPIYVAQQAIALGQDDLTPVDKVEVWFQQNVQTSTMFSEAVSNAIEVDLTDVDTQTVLYQGGVWSTPPMGQ
jgi:hypothetical protein